VDVHFSFKNPGKPREEKALIKHIINISLYECAKVILIIENKETCSNMYLKTLPHPYSYTNNLYGNAILERLLYRLSLRLRVIWKI
jgi:hypothetical protein